MAKITSVQLQIIRKNKRQYFNSKALHEALELDPNHYARWIANVLDNPCLKQGIDFIEADNNGLRGRPSSQYLLSMSFSESICITTGTAISKKVREMNF